MKTHPSSDSPSNNPAFSCSSPRNSTPDSVNSSKINNHGAGRSTGDHDDDEQGGVNNLNLACKRKNAKVGKGNILQKNGREAGKAGGMEGGRPVVTIKALSSSAKAGENWCEDKLLLPGDMVEQVSCNGVVLRGPFAGMKAGLQRELRRFFSINETLVEVQVRRGFHKQRQAADIDQYVVNVQASIVADDSALLNNIKKQTYALRAAHDPTHLVTFMDSTEEACIALQEMRCARVASQLTATQLKDAYVPYPWEVNMQRQSLVFSILFVPYSSGENRAFPSYNTVDDTVARAMTWLTAAQGSGIPITFLNIQTEPLLTKVSGQHASKCTVSASLWEDLSSVSCNSGIYGFEDYHGIDIGVVRAVRLWYVPTVAEMAIVLKPEEKESKLGLGICRTDEGFCCVSSVEDGTVADRAGLGRVHAAAKRAGKLLVISKVEEEKIAPTMVSSSGYVRCYDTVSISQKLVMHRRAGQAVRIYVLAWGVEAGVVGGGGGGGGGRRKGRSGGGAGKTTHHHRSACSRQLDSVGNGASSTIATVSAMTQSGDEHAARALPTEHIDSVCHTRVASHQTMQAQFDHVDSCSMGTPHNAMQSQLDRVDSFSFIVH